MQGHCTLSVGRDRLWRAASTNQIWTGSETVGENQGQDQEWTPCGGDLLQAAWQGRACWRDLLICIHQPLHSQAFIPISTGIPIVQTSAKKTIQLAASNHGDSSRMISWSRYWRNQLGELILDLVLSSGGDLIRGVEIEGSLAGVIVPWRGAKPEP